MASVSVWSVQEGCGKCACVHMYVHMYSGKTLSLSLPRVEGTKISRVTIYMLRRLAIYKVHLKFLVLI